MNDSYSVPSGPPPVRVRPRSNLQPGIYTDLNFTMAIANEHENSYQDISTDSDKSPMNRSSSGRDPARRTSDHGQDNSFASNSGSTRAAPIRPVFSSLRSPNFGESSLNNSSRDPPTPFAPISPNVRSNRRRTSSDVSDRNQELENSANDPEDSGIVDDEEDSEEDKTEPPKKKRRLTSMVLAKREILVDKSQSRYPRRNRIPPVRWWLGEVPIYKWDPEGGGNLEGVTEVVVRDKTYIKYRTASPIDVIDRQLQERKRRGKKSRKRRIT